MTKLLLLMVAACCGSTRIVHADSIAYQCIAKHPPASYDIANIQSPRGGPCRGFRLTAANNQLLQNIALDGGGSGYLWPSQDGRRALFIQGMPLASFDATGHLQVIHDGAISEDFDALIFFKDGHRIAAVPFTEIIARPHLVSVSASHIMWLLRTEVDPQENFLPDTVVLTTTSYRQLSFDTEKGRLIAATDTVDWKECDRIYYGDLHHSDAGWTMTPVFPVKGPGMATLSLTTVAQGLSLATGYRTLCVNADQGRWIAQRTLPSTNGVTLPRAQADK
ncbi:MAG: hypothetical protein HYV02_02865 [Deltaproteobacteria bacterium]|nr:hypothetical protein [Deltaproteobacteria bacterium]